MNLFLLFFKTTISDLNTFKTDGYKYEHEDSINVKKGIKIYYKITRLIKNKSKNILEKAEQL